VEKRIREAIDKVEKEIREGGKNRRGWLDEECWQKEGTKKRIEKMEEKGGEGREYKRRKEE